MGIDKTLVCGCVVERDIITELCHNHSDLWNAKIKEEMRIYALNIIQYGKCGNEDVKD